MILQQHSAGRNRTNLQEGRGAQKSKPPDRIEPGADGIQKSLQLVEGKETAMNGIKQGKLSDEKMRKRFTEF